MPLDHNRLENVKAGSGRISARCPACAAEGNDRAGTNLSIRTDSGAYTCARYPGESGRSHRSEIFRLAGIHQDRDPAADRAYRAGKVKVEAAAVPRKRVSRAIREKRADIIAAHPWTELQARAESPEQRIGYLTDPRRFLSALFPSDSIVWTGSVYASGKPEHAERWRTITEWQDQPEHTVGPMVTPATWLPGTFSRSADRIASAPYLVLDFDGFDGIKPTTPTELREHIAASLAITRWIREALQWPLAAVLYTGSKSVHAWFHHPEPAAIESLHHTADALGVDSSLIGHPEHPCRLPGWLHSKTGKPSRVLWLQSHPTP